VVENLSESEVKAAWTRQWEMGSSIDENASSVGRYLRKQRLQIMYEMLLKLPKSLSVIDMGSGNGSTLKVIRKAGFENSIGIEYAEKGIQASIENGFVRDKDVFNMDAGHTEFQNRHFGIVSSEGLWEHFKDPRPYMDEFIRIADRYIIVIQPDHYSLFGYFMKVAWDLLRSDKGGVKEYSFYLQYFIDYLKARSFKLIENRSTIFREQAVMLFKRMD
jgi:SAM-dependent methyltransferase